MKRFSHHELSRGLGLVLCAILATAAHAWPARAASVKVAVAANFTEAAREIGALFDKATGNKAIFSFGSTGQLYTQITQDAPFEVFLAADEQRPKQAVADGLAVPGSLFTYATGKVVLYSKDKDLVHGEDTLKQASFAKIAIANPATAPYGAAALQVMKAIGVYDAIAPKIVQGNNIAQTFQFVETRSAELGFVALSQIIKSDAGSRWVVPEKLYPTIAQDAVLLKRGADNEAAVAFVAFLKGPEARSIIERFGYGVGVESAAAPSAVEKVPAQ